MPLVLTNNEKNALPGYKYADKPGESYEYPAKYRSLVKPGERFVYYRGKYARDGSLQEPHYFGTGVIGPVSANGKNYTCLIEEYQPFAKVVPFKIDGGYLEPKANERPSREVGLHFQTGVRIIDEKTFDSIVSAGLSAREKKRRPVRATRLKKGAQTTKTAPNKVRDEAMKLALNEAEMRWPAATIFRAPSGAQFSLAVRSAGGVVRHIGVKGTTAATPRVRLTEAEIEYSKTHADSYSLWVFYGLNLAGGAPQLCIVEGEITADDVELEAALYGGLVKVRS